jgi:hypothetical protein
MQINSELKQILIDGVEMTLPAAPTDLSAHAREWWYRILAQHELDSAGMLLLHQAMQWLDVYTRLSSMIRQRAGTMDPRAMRAALANMDSAGRHLRNSLRCLNLDVNLVRDRPGRPPSPL